MTRINVETNELHGAAGCVTLTPTEGRLLRQLLAARGHPLSVRGLAQRLWGPYGGGEGAVKSHMCHLRGKLRAAGGASPRVDTVAGLGYLLREWA